jgi:hypothetical protein
MVNRHPKILEAETVRAFGLAKTETITWLSPLEEDGYAEYQDEAFLDLLGIELSRVPLAEFWPARGPVWDGLGRSKSGKLFLVEAKSHIVEMVSPATAASPKSKDLISRSIDQCKRYLNSGSKAEWTGQFYQYTNRLAHLYLLRKLNHLPAYLVFLYFLNDAEMNGPESVDEWKGAIKLVHSFLGVGRTKLTPFVADIFIDVRSLPETINENGYGSIFSKSGEQGEPE